MRSETETFSDEWQHRCMLPRELRWLWNEQVLPGFKFKVVREYSVVDLTRPFFFLFSFFFSHFFFFKYLFVASQYLKPTLYL